MGSHFQYGDKPERGKGLKGEGRGALGVCAAETSAPDVPQYVVGLRIPNYYILYLVVLKGGQIGSRAQAPRHETGGR